MLPTSSPEMLTLAEVTRWINAFIELCFPVLLLSD
jgi:hypothetical protein